MSETDLQSTAASPAPPRPLRHGASWERDEVERLIEEIQQGLALSELADRHQRTPTSITRAVVRLIPPPIRPASEVQSVDVLAKYLREHGDVDRQQLIADFCSARTVSAKPRPSESRQRSVAQEIAEPTLTIPSKVDRSPSEYAHLSLTEPTKPAAKTVGGGVSTTDVRMLVAVAITCLPWNRDSKVLEMRLGVNDQPLTLAEIGKQYSLSRERVRQLQERGAEKTGATCPRRKQPRPYS